MRSHQDYNSANSERLRRNAQRLKNVLTTANFAVNTTPTGTINGVNTVFTLAHAPVVGTEQIFLQGLLKTPGTDYTISGATVTFTVAPAAGPLRATFIF